jgi:hypothetical protein
VDAEGVVEVVVEVVEVVEVVVSVIVVVVTQLPLYSAWNPSLFVLYVARLVVKAVLYSLIVIVILSACDVRFG